MESNKYRKLYFWRITCVNRKKNKQNREKRQEKYDQKNLNEYKVIHLSRKDLGIFDKDLYLDSDWLTEQQKILVDIATRRKELLKDDSFFISLRNLFKKRVKNEINNVLYNQMTCISLLDYHEDENDTPIYGKEFIEIIHGKNNVIKLHNGIYTENIVHERRNNEDDIPELINMNKEDFDFTEEEINLLNTFIKDAYELSQTALFISPDAAKLKITTKLSYEQNITNEQLTSSLVVFRRLYLEQESTNYYKILNIMINIKKIHHPIYKVFSSFRIEYNKLLGKITSISLLTPILERAGISLEKITDKISGKNIIDAILYTGLIHQGKEKDHLLQNDIIKELKSIDLEMYCFII